MIVPDQFKDISVFNVWITKEVYWVDGPYWPSIKGNLRFRQYTPMRRPTPNGKDEWGRMYHKIRWHQIVALKLAGVPHEIDAQFP